MNIFFFIRFRRIGFGVVIVMFNSTTKIFSKTTKTYVNSILYSKGLFSSYMLLFSLFTFFVVFNIYFGGTRKWGKFNKVWYLETLLPSFEELLLSIYLKITKYVE